MILWLVVVVVVGFGWVSIGVGSGNHAMLLFECPADLTE